MVDSYRVLGIASMKGYVAVCAVAYRFSAGEARSAIAIAKMISKAAAIVVLPFEVVILFSFNSVLLD